MSAVRPCASLRCRFASPIVHNAGHPTRTHHLAESHARYPSVCVPRGWGRFLPLSDADGAHPIRHPPVCCPSVGDQSNRRQTSPVHLSRSLSDVCRVHPSFCLPPPVPRPPVLPCRGRSNFEMTDAPGRLPLSPPPNNPIYPTTTTCRRPSRPTVRRRCRQRRRRQQFAHDERRLSTKEHDRQVGRLGSNELWQGCAASALRAARRHSS